MMVNILCLCNNLRHYTQYTHTNLYDNLRCMWGKELGKEVYQGNMNVIMLMLVGIEDLLSSGLIENGGTIRVISDKIVREFLAGEIKLERNFAKSIGILDEETGGIRVYVRG